MNPKLTMTAALLALCVTMTAATLGPPFQPPADRQCLVTLPGQPKTGERIDSRNYHSRPCVPEPGKPWALVAFAVVMVALLARQGARER